jgi:hypothetical protein
MMVRARAVTYRQRQPVEGGVLVVRRAMAVLFMLVAVVLVHAVTPHHTSAPPRADTASQAPDQIRSGPHSVPQQVRAPSKTLHDDQQDPVPLLNRVQNTPVATGDADGSHMDGAVRESHSLSLLSHSTTARDRHRPAGSVTPTLSTLQTFRC